MNMTVTLWLYGWLYYPFYPLAVFHSTTAVEMALRCNQHIDVRRIRSDGGACATDRLHGISAVLEARKSSVGQEAGFLCGLQ
jgi:hypothetical protein